MEIEKKVNALGFKLPSPPVPAANYIGCWSVKKRAHPLEDRF